MISNYILILAENETLTCEERRVEFGSPLHYPVDIENVVRYMQITYYIICFLVGVFLNLIIIVFILCYKKLQSVTFFLAFQILISNLVYTSLIFPTSAANAIAGRHVLTQLCTIIGFAVFFMRNTRIYLMSVLVVDRFSSIFLPFWYQRHRVKVVTILSIVTWISSLIIALVPLTGFLDCYSFLHVTWACVPREGCMNKMKCNTYNYFWVALSNVCNAVILLLYLNLFTKVWKVRNSLKITPIIGQGTDTERAAAIKRLKRERRANTTFFLLFLALAGVSIPIGKIVLDALGIVEPSAYTLVGMIGWAAYHLLVIIDPIIIMRNSDFRAVVRKVLGKL